MHAVIRFPRKHAIYLASVFFLLLSVSLSFHFKMAITLFERFYYNFRLERTKSAAKITFADKMGIALMLLKHLKIRYVILYYSVFCLLF